MAFLFNLRFMERFKYNFQNAIEAVYSHLFRSILTALGIIFGVGAVIAMLAVGSGAKQEVLNQLELVGVNNIVIEPVLTKKDESGQGQKQGKNKKKAFKRFSGGLTLLDATSIDEVIPGIRETSPEVVYKTHAVKKGQRAETKLVGIKQSFFDVFNLDLKRGKNFNQSQMEGGEPVCIIGSGIVNRFFSYSNPLGEKIKVGNIWLKVIGVVESRNVTQQAKENLGIRDYNMDIYAPVKTVLRRYKNRALITDGTLQRRKKDSRDNKDDNENGRDDESTYPNYNQLDKIVVQVGEKQSLKATQGVITRMLKRRHNQVQDFRVKAPELLLKQQQETKNIFNIVLGSIAGISLLVGGIGIMNIMLASVMERTKEIGIRQALGATPGDIITQFVSEATVISLSGGLIGVGFGMATAKLITYFAGIETLITLPAIVLSFVVAASIGLIFGIYPAQKAAKQDPIESLRYE